ncbi:MAG TPA: AAA family ATPase [Nakamurella sp.]|nr:AAA family ATPase [Nakamurella sp.]
MPVGAVDRDEAADRVLKVLGAGGRGRSSWNVYDIRGVTEEVLAARSVIAPPRVFQELAEDVAARVEARCLSVVDRPVPEHLRHLTSQAVIDLERDLHGRLAVRGAVDHPPASVQDVAAVLVLPAPDGTERVLGEGQVAAVRAIAGTGPLVLIEGAAGAGKTTVLAVANDIITHHGHSMMVLAPSKKASMVAAERIGADASTAARLAYQHGYRWDDEGVWTRLRPGDVDPTASDGAVYTGPHSSARLAAGDVLVIDEAGMLDQETARALLHIADTADARVVCVGDRRQLPAVGRGGVLEMAARWATTQVEVGAVHRFRTPDGDLDTEYADLTMRIRSGVDPETVFDDLNAGGHVKVWDSEADALAHLAVQAADRHLDGVSQAVAVDTNDTAAAVNEVVRDHLVTAGAVDDTTVTHGSDGLRIGVGDQVMTRRNDPDLGVANRMTWTVTGFADTGGVQLHNQDRRQDAAVDADYVRQHLHLAYASTVHGVQGDTADHADSLLSDSTDAAAAYVALTRGRCTNTVHIVAGSVDEAREKWVQAAGRNRADLGLDQARAAARNEARNYAAITEPERRPEPAGEKRSSFADRIRQISARLADDQTRDSVTVVDAPAAADEWDGIDEHQDHDTPTQSGPHL